MAACEDRASCSLLSSCTMLQLKCMICLTVGGEPHVEPLRSGNNLFRIP